MTPLSSLHTTKFDACDIMMSISTDWASFFGCIFWILNHKTMKLSRQLTFPRTIFLGNTLNALVDWCLVPGPLWFTYLLQFFNNQLPMIYSFSLNWKDALRQLKKHIQTTKHQKILLYCQFTKTIKDPGTSFQTSELNQKHNGNLCQNLN